MKQPKFIILPSKLEDVDLMVQDLLRVYNNEEMIQYKRRADETVPDIGPEHPLKYIDIRSVYFANDVISLLKNIVEVGQKISSAEGMDHLDALEIQAIELIKKIDKAFQQ